MQFRVRPASKRSSHAQLSIIQFPTSKSLAGGESSLLPRSVVSRIDQLQASITHMQELHKRERQIGNTGFVQVQKRLDKVEYKLFSTQQDLKQLSQIRQIKQPRQNLLQVGSEPSKNEIMVLKQVLLQDKQAQRESIKHLHAQIQQLSLKMLRQEQETRGLLGHQRMQMEHRLNGQGDQLREIQSLKQKKIQKQYQMIKGVIANAERKIFEELERKIRNQTVVKDLMEEKIAELKEQLNMEHRQTLASETKFIKQTKQSLQTLFALINSFKKELSQELTQTQKLTTSSIKKLSMTLDIAREKSSDQIKQAVQMHQQVSNEIVQLRNFVTNRLQENRQSINQFSEQKMERIDHGTSHSKTSSNINTERFSQLQKEMNQWKVNTQQKNLNVFKQISNTLKTMKLEWRKENDELVCEVAAINESLKALKKSGPSEIKKSVQALVSIFNNQFDVLAEELQTMTDMISLAKKENEKTLKEGLGKLKVEVEEEIKNAVNQKTKESNQYTDKSTNRSEQHMKNYVQKELKFVNEGLSQKIQQSESLLRQLQSLVKKSNVLTTAQLQQYSLKLKNFNDNYEQYLEQQRKDDMKKRMELQESMRKNTNALMDIYYKKTQFLMEGLKNNIEVSQMKEKVEAAQALDNAKDQIKKQIQNTRVDWNKQFIQGIEKLTKQRESSEETLRETIQLSLNNAKRNLSNQIGNNKLEIQEKINEMKGKEVLKQAEQQQKLLSLKNNVLQMIRDQKRLNQQTIQKTKQQLQSKMTALEKIQVDKDAEYKSKLESQKKQIQTKLASLEKSHAEKDVEYKGKLQEVETKMAALEKTQNDRDFEYKGKFEAQKKQLQTKIAAVQKLQIDKDTEYKGKLQAQKKEIDLKLAALQKNQADKDTESKSKLDAQKKQIDAKIAVLEKVQTDKDADYKTKLAAIQKIQVDKDVENKTRFETHRKQIDTKIAALQKTQTDKDAEYKAKLQGLKKEIEAKVGTLQKTQGVKDTDYKTKLEAQTKEIEIKIAKLQKIQLDKDAEYKAKLQAQKKEIETKMTALQKAEADKDASYKSKLEVQKKQMQLLLSTQIKKIQSSQKQLNSKAKSGLQQDLTGLNKITKEMSHQIQELKKAKNVSQQEFNQYKQETKGKLTKLEEEKKKTTDEKVKGEQDYKVKEGELDKKINALTQSVETNYKTLNQKIVQANNKIGESLSKIEKQKAPNADDGKTKEAEIMKNLTTMSEDIEAKNKSTNVKIQQITKKLNQIQTNSEKKEGDGKKVGEQSLNQLKSQLQKSISELQARISELQLKDKSEENEEAIAAIRKSLNKLEAMTFSEQAKNKTLFDRLNEDVNKLSENLTLIANQIRQ